MSFVAAVSCPGSPTVPRSADIPIPEHKAIILNALNSAFLSPPSFGTSRQVAPIHTPCTSPPPTMPPSGYLDEAKISLQRAMSKRNTKSSSLSIDEDMKDMCCYYRLLGTDEKNTFLEHLATQHSIDHSAIEDLITNRPSSSDQISSLIKWEDKLRISLQPPHSWIVSQISRLTGGVKFLVDLRHHLLVSISNTTEEETLMALKQLDSTLKEMLSLWFTVGLVQLARITWDSSCNMLQKISEYEAVHPIRNWTDLKRRVGQYRRCFVFTHSCMPNEPLVVLHTFLTSEISKSMTKIVQNPRFVDDEDDRVEVLQEEDSSTITTAIFYSITSTQKGLQGIELGNYLIKRVVKELQAELPHLSQFSSLSPIPTFVKWLHSAIAKAIRGEIKLFTDSEFQTFCQLLMSPPSLDTPKDGKVSPSDDSLKLKLNKTGEERGNNTATVDVDIDRSLVYQKFRQMLSTNSWSEDSDLKNFLETPLTRLCAYYLYVEKRRSYALDSVANFHLKNGAVMWRINWGADPSPRGLSNSCGIMVNYRYFLAESELNSRGYQEKMTVNAEKSVIQLAVEADTIINKTSLYHPPPNSLSPKL